MSGNLRKELEDLIENIKAVTGFNQQTISKEAGYAAKTITQVLSSGERLEPLIKQLRIVFRHELRKSTSISSEMQGYPNIVIPEEVRQAVLVLNKFVNQNAVKTPEKRSATPDKSSYGITGSGSQANRGKSDKDVKGKA